jgi:16S rRNA (guanine527-N7)-methyltransferase
MLDILVAEATRYGVRLDEQQIAQFRQYLSLLNEWSRRANLVGDAAPEVVQRRHFAESVALGAALREREILRPQSRVIDVGAGAGFPGIPIKLAWPACSLTLLEATAKKTAFLQAVIDALGLTDATVVTARAERAGHDPKLRGRFDIAFARAVAPLPALLELALPLVRVGGRMVTPKGSRAEREVTEAAGALATLRGRAFVVPFGVPGPPQRLVVVVKMGETPAAYPRREGLPVRAPL